MSERSRLALRAENVAENISLYAAEQLTVKLQGMGTPVVGHFPWTGPATNSMILYMPPASTSGTDNVLVSEYNTLAAANAMELRAGIGAKTGYTKVDDPTSANNGLQVATANVPIIVKGTATHPAVGTVTTYLEQDMQLTLIPLFQFGMFYNMDLELYPSGDLTLTGPVHTNNSLFAHPDAGSTKSITFTDRVTAADYIIAYQGVKCDTRGGDGTKSTPGDPTLGNVYFTDATGTKLTLNMKSNGSSTTYLGLTNNRWADGRWGDTTINATTNPPISLTFQTWENNSYHGNLRSKLDLVTKLVLPGIGGYKETNDPSTPEDDRNNGRQIIESPDPKLYNGTTFATTTDSAAIKQVKISWRAGLYIMVNPSDIARSAELPDGNSYTVAPRSYRCWLNSSTGGTRTCTEVVLPGQPTYGQDPGPDGNLGTSDDAMYLNYLPNRLMNGTSVGANQVLRTIQQPYGTGTTGYKVTVAGAVSDTALTVSGGVGTILAGDIVTIGLYRYLVASDLTGTTLNIASPGLIAAAPSTTAVTIYTPTSIQGTGTGYLINHTVTYAIGTTASPVYSLTIDTGSNSILPGNTISIGSGAGTYKYLVTAVNTSLPVTTVWIAKPGLAATVADNTAVMIDPAGGTLGTATDYAINAAASVGATTLTVNQGVGTLFPGNIVVIGGNRYLVASAANGSTGTTALTTLTITPGLLTSAAVGILVSIDPYAYSGYASSGNGGSGSVFPADSSTNAYAAEAYFYDLRRANNNGAIGNAGSRSDFNRSTSNPYTPRPIAKIDLDMARFKMMVNRAISSALTSSGYQLSLPTNSGTGWGNCIFNSAATPTSLGLGIYDSATASYSAIASFPASTTAVTKLRQDPFGLYYAPVDATGRAAVFTDPTQFLVTSTALSTAWNDGIAVFIHSVDAEVRAQTVSGVADRVDSGVRLVNGRGPVASLAPNLAPDPDSSSGCTIATNDATYIIGHYNADGTINSTLTASGFGGYSSTWPDSSREYLCAVYGDATTIMSQPTFAESGSSGNRTYAQTDGWCDALSALPHSTASANWRTTAAGSVDGVITTGMAPGALPTINKPAAAGSATIKLAAVPTEVSTVLVIGIVPSNANPAGLSDRPPSTVANNVNSGGANNFPRFLEAWGDSNPLYIRGSMIALFESRIAMEPFTHSRCYNRPVRCWGLNNSLSVANHHVPLEPIVYSADRLGFHQLSAAAYATRKAAIEAWPVLTP